MAVRSLLRSVTPAPVRSMVKGFIGRAGRVGHGLKERMARPNLYNFSTRERIGIVYTNPSEMTVPERLFVYSLVRATRPARVLEIGSRHGGSAAIICSAMEDNGVGRLVGIDPFPEITVNPRHFHGRFELVKKTSPEGMEDARRIAGGEFDLVFIDGLHTYSQVTKDIEGSLPHLVRGGHLLFHDAFNYGVSEAIREAIERRAGELHDCGLMATTPDTASAPLAYQGLKLVRFDPAAVASPGAALEEAYKEARQPVPALDPDLRDHDVWYCRHVKPCSYCVKHGVGERGEVVGVR